MANGNGSPDPWAQRLTAAAALVSAVGTVVIFILQWIHGTAINDGARKADKAAKAAAKAVAAVEESHVAEVAKIEEVAKTTNETAKSTALGTAITAQWRAEHTGDPDDMAKAVAAERTLEKHDLP